ncbi:MAG TPA: hypothetical protein VEA37_07040, partial [Flavobacterium sp.]|nr:hypothetical protein [Flavobacterium sp.]
MAKKVFISFRFTGEDPVELKDMISNIEKSLSKGSHETYCSLVDEDFFRDNKYTNGQIMEHAFDRTDESDVMLAILKSN